MHKIKSELEKMLIREKRMEIFNSCLAFLDTRVELDQNGFKFDGGPTVITAPHLIYELFEMFNKDPSNYIKIKPLDVWYRFVFEDGFSFDYSGNENSMRDQIEKISKKDLNGYIKLVDFTKRIFDKGANFILTRSNCL